MRLAAALLFISLMFACSQNEKGNDLENIQQPMQLIRYQFFDSDLEKNLSFPLIFDRSVIKHNGLKSIVRKYFVLDSLDNIRQIDLREERHYHFNESLLQSIELSYYYDHRTVGRKKVVYDMHSKVLGYRKAYIIRDSGMVSDKEFVESGFHVHQLLEQTGRVLKFKDVSSGHKLFFLPKKEHWGALSVDSICHPRPTDKIVLGMPWQPRKIYSVENKIKEKSTVEFTYHPFLGRVERMVSNDFPFTLTRTFFYNKKGYCNSYVDSTFSSKEFLMRTVSTIRLNSKKLPVLIVHRKETSYRQLGVTSYEKFIYEK
ncbi:MAG: hypothetical protein LW688_10495 [Cryomorphaceae bacterium]|jgi:hypothetical protein|nr:hypothetical protein [Cryomorphaceae bacterium]